MKIDKYKKAIVDNIGYMCEDEIKELVLNTCCVSEYAREIYNKTSENYSLFSQKFSELKHME